MCIRDSNKAIAWLIGIVGSIYGIWLLYASGLQYILIATILYAPGSIMSVSYTHLDVYKRQPYNLMSDAERVIEAVKDFIKTK